MMAGDELDKFATGNEMSHNSQKSQIFPNTNLYQLEKTAGYLQLRSFILLALHNLYLGAVLDDSSWKLAVPKL